MTVRELITELLTYDTEAQVVITHPETNAPHEVALDSWNDPILHLGEEIEI